MAASGILASPDDPRFIRDTAAYLIVTEPIQNSRQRQSPGIGKFIDLSVIHKALSILLVEDDPADAALAVRVLNQRGFMVSARTVGSEQAFRRQLNLHTFDLVLADCTGADWTALQALEVLQQLEIPTPLIVFTRMPVDALAADWIKKGAADCISKNQPQRLPLAVAAAITQQRSKIEQARQGKAGAGSEQ